MQKMVQEEEGVEEGWGKDPLVVMSYGGPTERKAQDVI